MSIEGCICLKGVWNSVALGGNVRKCVRIRVRVDAGEVKAVCMHA